MDMVALSSGDRDGGDGNLACGLDMDGKKSSV